MKFKRVPIWRDAICLLIEVETVVRHFSCYHKYTLGVARMKLRVIREQGVDHTPWYQQGANRPPLLNNNVLALLEYVAHIPRIPPGFIRATVIVDK